MAINTYGGGARTNRNGLRFEQETSLEQALCTAGYSCYRSGEVFCGDTPFGMLAGKHGLYKRILEPNGVEWRNIISKKLLPDEAFLNRTNHTIYIIEKKFQHDSGSVDEKLQTCAFKKRQYQLLFSPLGIAVEYFYVCNDFFRQDCYRDVLKYIDDVGCRCFFNEIPLNYLCLPPAPRGVAP